ncbi:hypothetical protein HJFPF1_05892 [Paramyrothecium foliicola]|nr:hypothetical protein HJFPF1_05892 [Paramyrothecium foliicola]
MAVNIHEYHLRPTKMVPNSPHPLLHYQNALPRRRDNAEECSPVAAYDLFTGNEWRVEWIFRYGNTQVSHFHSQAHEVMAVLSGSATIRFGVGDTSEDLADSTYGSGREEGGVELKAQAGDIFLIPAGVAHKTHDTTPKSEFKLLTPGKGHGLATDNPREMLGMIELSGFTMMGAYSGGEWDFMKEGGDQQSIWAIAKPEHDPVLGDSREGMHNFWK